MLSLKQHLSVTEVMSRKSKACLQLACLRKQEMLVFTFAFRQYKTPPATGCCVLGDEPSLGVWWSAEVAPSFPWISVQNTDWWFEGAKNQPICQCKQKVSEFVLDTNVCSKLQHLSKQPWLSFCAFLSLPKAGRAQFLGWNQYFRSCMERHGNENLGKAQWGHWTYIIFTGLWFTLLKFEGRKAASICCLPLATWLVLGSDPHLYELKSISCWTQHSLQMV